MEKIRLAHGFLKETVTTIMMVCSIDGDTNFFNIVAGFLQGNILVLYTISQKYLSTFKNFTGFLVSLFNDISTFVGYLMP